VSAIKIKDGKCPECGEEIPVVGLGRSESKANLTGWLKNYPTKARIPKNLIFEALDN